MSANIKLSKTKISETIQFGGLSGSSLSKIASPLMEVAVPLATVILVSLGITAAASAIDARIQKKMHGSGKTTLIIANEEMDDLIKIVQALEYSGIEILKGITETIKN